MKIIVLDKIYVQGYGMGPFLYPIEVDEKTLQKLKSKSRIKILKEVSNRYPNTTFPIKLNVDKKYLVVEETTPESQPVVEESVTDEVADEPQVQAVEVEENVEESVTDEVADEPQVQAEEFVPVVGDGILDTEEELKELTVSELKAKLDEMGVDYLYKDTKSVLIQKILKNL